MITVGLDPASEPTDDDLAKVECIRNELLAFVEEMGATVTPRRS
jgi:hypothetical protein